MHYQDIKLHTTDQILLVWTQEISRQPNFNFAHFLTKYVIGRDSQHKQIDFKSAERPLIATLPCQNQTQYNVAFA